MACTLAESPSDPFHRKLRQFRCLHYRLDCYRVERTSSRAGVAPAEVQRLSRRTISPIVIPGSGAKLPGQTHLQACFFLYSRFSTLALFALFSLAHEPHKYLQMYVSSKEYRLRPHSDREREER